MKWNQEIYDEQNSKLCKQLPWQPIYTCSGWMGEQSHWGFKRCYLDARNETILEYSVLDPLNVHSKSTVDAHDLHFNDCISFGWQIRFANLMGGTLESKVLILGRYTKSIPIPFMLLFWMVGKCYSRFLQPAGYFTNPLQLATGHAILNF